MHRACCVLASLSLALLTPLTASAQSPQITSISPASAPIGQTITIRGTNFGSYGYETTVVVNTGQAAPPAPILWTSTEIQVVVPNSAAQGAGTVKVENSNAYPFTVTNTLSLQEANNTSACSSSSNPTNNPSYCGSNYFNGFDDTKNPKSSLQTYVVDSPAGHISLTEPLRSLINPNVGSFWPVCEYQPWFGDPGHKSVGYNENNSATVHAQVNNMIARGCGVVLLDWYNGSIGNGFELSVENLVFQDLQNREDGNYGDGGQWPAYPIYYAVLEDQGNWSATCPGFQTITAISEAGNTVTVTTKNPTGAAVGSSVNINGVPNESGYNGNWTVSTVLNSYQFTYVDTESGLASESSGSAGVDQTSCIQSALETDLDTIKTNYLSGPYLRYTTSVNFDVGQGPLIGFFICPSCFNAEWNTTIWPNVFAWAQQNFPYPFQSPYFFFEFGSYVSDQWDGGEYGWPQPLAWSSSNQYIWDNSNYLTNLYADAKSAWSSDAQGGMGVFYKGFDDTNASWSTNRVMAQQCGQVWWETAQFPTTSFDPLALMQIATWNDYEEATEIETGIDNCYTVPQPTLTGTPPNSTLNWTLNKSSSYANQETINHFTIWYADASNNLYLAKDNIPASSRSQSLTGLIPSGTWTLYVEMVGQSSIINRMSTSGVSYTP